MRVGLRNAVAFDYASHAYTSKQQNACTQLPLYNVLFCLQNHPLPKNYPSVVPVSRLPPVVAELFATATRKRVAQMTHPGVKIVTHKKAADSKLGEN